MRLTDYIDTEQIRLDMDVTDVESTLAALAQCAATAAALPDPEAITRALLVRESAHSTAMGSGVAIPHATVPELGQTLLILGTAPGGIAFGSDDGGLTRVFFALLSPLGAESEHIKLLARICRLVRHPGFIDSLTEARTPDEALEIVAHVDAQHV